MKKHTTEILGYLLLTLISCNQTPTKGNFSSKIADTSIITSDKSGQEDSKQVVDKSLDELAEFIPTGYSVLQEIPGDLNLDKISDYLLVLKKNDEEDTIRRPLLILIRDKSNKLNLAKRNDNTVLCIDCGGAMGDPFVGITIKNGYFSVEHYGGSAWRWTNIITYKYSKQDNEWYLDKNGTESFQVTEPEKIERNIKTTKDFGKVKFEDFDIYKDEE